MFKLISNDIAQKSFETLHFEVASFRSVNNFKSFFDETIFSPPGTPNSVGRFDAIRACSGSLMAVKRLAYGLYCRRRGARLHVGSRTTGLLVARRSLQEEL